MLKSSNSDVFGGGGQLSLSSLAVFAEKNCFSSIIGGVAEKLFSEDKRVSLLKGRSRAYRKSGFTLAEVLITLGVIGVVAAMTMPVFINKYQKHVAAKRLQTIYSQLAQAIQRAEYENGAKMSVWVPFGWDSGPGLAKALAPYLKATYYDPSGTTVSESFCYRGGTIKPYKDGLGRVLPENTSSFINPSCTASISLPSGACVGFNGIAWCPDSMGTIPVDVDGPYSGPNQYGKDVFVFNYFASSGYWGLYLGNNNPKDQEFYTCLKSTNNLYNVRSCTKAIAANNWTIPDNFKGW